MCQRLPFAEKGRQRLLLLAGILDAVLVGDFVVFVIVGAEMITKYAVPLSLIKGLDAFLLARLLIWNGFVGSCLHFFDIWISWIDTQFEDKKSGLKIVLIFFILKMCFLASLFIVGVVLFVQSAQITFELKTGFLPALHNYSKFPSVKENIDILQQYFSCCGDRDYQDWFSIQWIPDIYLHPKIPRIGQNVPFSCCDPSAMRPCVSNKINDRRPNYDKDKDKTVFLKGCRQSFANSYSIFKTNWITIPWGIAIGTYVVHVIAVRSES